MAGLLEANKMAEDVCAALQLPPHRFQLATTAYESARHVGPKRLRRSEQNADCL
jgi:hypothetical protein